jgi:NADPH-dependent glutamate synthase beta subunit-like oxidoreductase/ferredoxin
MSIQPMPKLTIDQREVEVPPGATVLDAARRLGIDIPALCFLETCELSTSCLCCLVRINGGGRLVPSCATVVSEGMKVESETPEIHSARRKSLELLLSDHLGDCVAPCFLACPAQMDIPQMLRQISQGDMRGAIATVKRDIALSAVLGRICPAPCEKICRRHDLDAAVAICLLKRYVADVDLASGDPYLPTCLPTSGKKVAIIGAGPTGLSAAYYLMQSGHACTVFDENQQPGGRLWEIEKGDRSNLLEQPEGCFAQIGPVPFFRDVLNSEIEQITRLGIEMRLKNRIESRQSFQELLNTFDAVLIACGSTVLEQAGTWELKTSARGIQVAFNYQTELPKVFAAGSAVRGQCLVVRSVADGKEAAVSIDQYLRGQVVTGPDKPFTTKIGRMESEELLRFSSVASKKGTGPICAKHPPGRSGKLDLSPFSIGLSAEEATVQAARCLHCDCRGLHTCKLRKYADLYGADPRRYKGHRREFEQDARHADVIFEPGKCIDCGLCIQIAAAAGESLGLTFVGRGFNVRVAVPLDRHLDEALRSSAAQCVVACPTAALAFKDDSAQKKFIP